MSGYDDAIAVLPPDIRGAAITRSKEFRSGAREFRLRLGKPPTVLTEEREQPLNEHRVVEAADLTRLLEIAAGASPYAAAEGMDKGYITARGGVRIGLCGQRNRTSRGNWAWTDLTSAAVRIPREVKGCAASICRFPPVSTLIVGPPGKGKTTLLRDMVRIYSDRGYRTGLCDERGEVAAADSRGAGFDVGASTDVITGLPKGEAAFQLLRTMNPQIIAVDEITEKKDAAACTAAARCGVMLLATAHNNEGMSFRGESAADELVRTGAFRRIVSIRCSKGRWSYEVRCLT